MDRRVLCPFLDRGSDPGCAVGLIHSGDRVCDVDGMSDQGLADLNCFPFAPVL
jgi:hypothetical protein